MRLWSEPGICTRTGSMIVIAMFQQLPQSISPRTDSGRDSGNAIFGLELARNAHRLILDDLFRRSARLEAMSR
jgi:hypothetical protein